MACLQVVLGSMVSGAARLSSCTRTGHHLGRAGRGKVSGYVHSQARLGRPPQNPHHGLFSESASSFRKPFCSIHLSLRNLDLHGKAQLAKQPPPGPSSRGCGICPQKAGQGQRSQEQTCPHTVHTGTWPTLVHAWMHTLPTAHTAGRPSTRSGGWQPGHPAGASGPEPLTKAADLGLGGLTCSSCILGQPELGRCSQKPPARLSWPSLLGRTLNQQAGSGTRGTRGASGSGDSTLAAQSP